MPATVVHMLAMKLGCTITVISGAEQEHLLSKAEDTKKI